MKEQFDAAIERLKQAEAGTFNTIQELNHQIRGIQLAIRTLGGDPEYTLEARASKWNQKAMETTEAPSGNGANPYTIPRARLVEKLKQGRWETARDAWVEIIRNCKNGILDNQMDAGQLMIDAGVCKAVKPQYAVVELHRLARNGKYIRKIGKGLFKLAEN